MPGFDPDADVIIRMKGLGIGYYNSNDSLWEFIFLRKIPDHNLRITIIEYLKNGTERQATYSPEENIDEISITSTGFNNRGRIHQQPKPFKWRRNDDHYDSRWLVNLSSELHKKPVKLSKKSHSPPISFTYMAINGAKLYTQDRTNPTTPYRLVDSNNIDIPSSPRVLGQYVGLAIDWKGGGARNTIISYSGMNIPPLRPNSDVDYYEIDINNDCPDAACVGPTDFHYYYDYLVDMGNEVFREIVPYRIVSLRESLFELLGISDLTVVGADNSEQSIFNLFSLQDLKVKKVAKTDCHLVMVDDLADGRESLYYLKGS